MILDNKIIRIGITGQAGFLGTHLFNKIGLYENKYIRIPFEDEYFNNAEKLEEFVSQCDVIVHLAAMNRHKDPQIIYDTNIRLTKKLLDSCESLGATPHIIFSSSSQEELDNLYGKSKKDGRDMLIEWSKRHNAKFTGLIIPNVFGPFGRPYYNSVVATFCHQLSHNEIPKIQIDNQIALIYVNELTEYIISIINNSYCCENLIVPHTTKITVSKLRNELQNIKDNYFKHGIIPDLTDEFDRNLFITFLTYVDFEELYPYFLKSSIDDRGNFIELMKTQSGGQTSFSTTKPGITRGNHFHTRKAERFIVIKGKARIKIRKIGSEEVFSFELDGENPSFIDIPIWYTHNIENIGTDVLYTVFWINELYNSNDPDTFYETV